MGATENKEQVEYEDMESRELWFLREWSFKTSLGMCNMSKD